MSTTALALRVDCNRGLGMVFSAVPVCPYYSIPMTHDSWFRIALGYMTVFSLLIGVWALLAPQSFYDSFPGLGRAWISVDGPYNEHLIRDVGALNLALVVLFVAAAVTLSRSLVMTAAAASLAWGVPHALYHLFNTDQLGGLDIAASLGGLLLFAALPVLILLTARTRIPQVPSQASEPHRGSDR